jgi:hypothetical protein
LREGTPFEEEGVESEDDGGSPIMAGRLLEVVRTLRTMPHIPASELRGEVGGSAEETA